MASDVDNGADAKAGVAPSVAASSKELDPLGSNNKSVDEDNDEYGTADDKSKNDDYEQSKDFENDDDGGEMNDIIHSLTTRDVAAGRRTTTTTRKGAKAGTKTATMARTATVAEPTSRKRKATGSSGADEQAWKGLRQR